MAYKIIHISDTHLREFPQLEPADLLVHSGDGLNIGSLKELHKLKAQLTAVAPNYKHVLYVPGNHDWIFEEDPDLAIEFLEETIPNLRVLIHDEWVIPENGLKVFGTAWQPAFCSWAFNMHPVELHDKYKEIPDDVNILVTHAPAKGRLDYVINTFNPNGTHVGSPELQIEMIRFNQLKVHMFGHIHYSAGQKLDNGIVYSNGSICDERYHPTNQAQVIELDV